MMLVVALELYCMVWLCCMLWFHLLWLCLQCFAGASQCWPGLCCAEQNVSPQLLGTPHTALSILGIALQHFWHEACPVHVCVARNPPQGYGTGTSDTSNLSAGLNSHFSAPLSFAFSRANSLGQCSFTADCGCI